MGIKNLSIENYRFFKENQVFDFELKGESKNILLYGENGSGKTSLYNTLTEFFFYYKDKSTSKEKIIENKNIFSNPTDEPKIEIIFDNNTTIKLTKDGFDKDDLKSEIEQVSKSKLFLTYKDIHSLNNIFKKKLTYQEFKDVFTILYYDELNDKFNEFEQCYIKVKDIVKNKKTLESYVDYLSNTLNNFVINDLTAIDDLCEKDETGNYTKVFYLSDNYESTLNEYKELIDTFFKIIANKNTLEFDTYTLSNKYDDIEFNINRYTIDNCRYLESDIDIEDAKTIELDSFKLADDFFNELEALSEFITNFIICEELAENINEIIYNKLDSSIQNINDTLEFLDINIKIDKILEKPFLYFDTNYIFNQHIRSIEFKIKLSGKELKNHWSNLNEAKLSALNFTIYLSSILQKKPDIPILVLDDLLISLDMSNRDKMIDLLLDRTRNADGNYRFFDDEYQMFIFTHDKAFFEMAKYKFDNKNKDNWKYLEMYEDSSGMFPKPLLIPSENHLEKAESYFKLCDYPTAGHCLRKASEKIITAKTLDTFKASEKDGLDRIIQKYEDMCKEFNIPIPQTIQDSKALTKRVFNPSSHDDLVSPLYKKEIKDAIELVSKLKELSEIKETATSIKKESLLKFKHDGKYEIIYIFLGDVKLYTYEDTILNRDSILLSKSMHKLLVGTSWEECWTLNNKFFDLKKIFKIMKYFIHRKFDILIDEEIFISCLTIDGVSLTADIKKLFKKQCNEESGN